MNIPYAEFYKAETTNNTVDVDAFTSCDNEQDQNQKPCRWIIP